jgi:superfamily I DNA/RNA helicase
MAVGGGYGNADLSVGTVRRTVISERGRSGGTLDALGLRLHQALVGKVTLAAREQVIGFIKEAAKAVGGHKFTTPFLVTEWDQVVDAWQIDGWEAYRDVPRLGRKTRLSETQRKTLWTIFEKVRAALAEKKVKTLAAVFTWLAGAVGKAKNRPYDFAVVDESQDLGVAHLRFFAALGNDRENALFFAGDLGQRIFQQQFSWKALGVDIRGRSKTLRVNYRTSHQIRAHADRLLGPEVADGDGNAEKRNDTVSVFNGPPPEIRTFKTDEDESKAVGQWLADRVKAGFQPHECGVFVRSAAQIERAKAALIGAKVPFTILDEHVETAVGQVSVCTMHLAKGLEFRAVAVMACDDVVVPLQERIATVGEDSDLKEVYDTERQLLYVACTRARDFLLITAVLPASEYLDDLISRPDIHP